MACQCPVIATAATGAEDLFTDGVEGFLLPDRDPSPGPDAGYQAQVDALRMRLQQLADDAELQRRFAAASLARVRSFGGWDDYGARWETLLFQLTGRSREMEEATL
jgi:starch synthase